MRYFLINLAKNTERLGFMESEFNSLGLKLERIDAIYGKELATTERKQRFASLRSLIAMRRRMSDGEIGCALSHIKVCKKMVDEGVPVACIFEDDVVIDNRFPEVLKMVENRLDLTKPQAVVFSGYHIDGAESFPLELKREQAIWCADAYLLTLPAAKLILKANSPVVTVADAFKRWRRFFGLELYHAFPSTAKQANDRFGSDLNIPRKVNWLLRQVFWLIDFILIKAGK